jgi:hypothetical protein
MAVLVTFCFCDKVPEINNLKGGNIYFGSQLQRFQFTVAGSSVSGPVVRQNIMEEGSSGANLLIL